jgi:hypothetical protein
VKIITKILSVVAVIIGLMAVVVGTRVLFGVFDPGYQYYTSLISYNIILGIVSIITAFLIWKRNGKALLFSGIITGLHLSVLLSLVTIFSDIISDHSVKAMTFRFVIWLVITIVLWKLNPKLKDV